VEAATPVRGTIPALLTPFDADGALALDVLDEHVAWLAAHGVTCVSPLGTTGEGASLSLEERKRVVERVARHTSGVSQLPGTGMSSLPETIELSLFALEQGAAGVLVIPPWFFQASPRGTLAYFRALVDALPTGAPVFPYHIPSFSRVPVEDDVLRLPGVAGVKDSGGDLRHTLAWLREFPALVVLSGNDTHAAEMYAAGGRGTLTMLANVFPDRLEAIRRGEDVDASTRFLTGARALVESMPRHAALKYLVHRRAGVPRSRVRPPLDELGAEHEERLDALVASA
jgi:4-hydroxy-tetrahydrodipicolinate synthase